MLLLPPAQVMRPHHLHAPGRRAITLIPPPSLSDVPVRLPSQFHPHHFPVTTYYSATCKLRSPRESIIFGHSHRMHVLCTCRPSYGNARRINTPRSRRLQNLPATGTAGSDAAAAWPCSGSWRSYVFWDVEREQHGVCVTCRDTYRATNATRQLRRRLLALMQC